ncbi:hypothetical protein BRADI_1g56266v3 [Brachypodium distachyon]|uniref:Uncharacterized protein n=1 Tax=Brachypodium distachyon TaxID=15368 RepID=A0A0Q3HCU5_BRADI|nr:hypothetical protein BRADI_1g56266v3 [Brachypodium distachyon]
MACCWVRSSWLKISSLLVQINGNPNDFLHHPSPGHWHRQTQNNHQANQEPTSKHNNKISQEFTYFVTGESWINRGRPELKKQAGRTRKVSSPLVRSSLRIDSSPHSSSEQLQF